ncbi:MAG: PEP-CTERM sorting domain-containing protein [Gemmatimonadales bacterium]|nr:PEP-CTERM sorting domain-containing protein [Gemmatimonadales bacterium]
MKLNQLVLRVAAVAVVGMSLPTSAQAQLWYNGDINGVNALSSERNTVVSQSMAYDNFVVTGAGWTINSVFGNFLANFAWSTADYEIRTGVSVGNGGTVVASGSGFAASQVATGNTAFGFTEYTATISGLSIFLNPGTYWLGISPVGTGNNNTDRAFVGTTSGTNGNNANIDGLSFFNSTFFGANFVNSDTQTGAPSDFAYGVDGAGSGLSTGGDDVVPEPATMTLLATGLAGMAAARRRKAAKA